MWSKLWIAVGMMLLAAGAQETTPPEPGECPVVQDTGVRRAGLDSGVSLVLNLPSFRLDVYDSGRNVRSYTVTVGMPGFRTPRGSFLVTDIEWNPWWNPPNSEWARDEEKTPPGPANPMGKVKMNFTPYYFLHGTPLESSLGRAASHGCVRMRSADAVDLALLLHGSDSVPVLRETLDSLIGNRETRRFVLSRPVPISLRYELVEWRTDTLFIHRDVYRLADDIKPEDVVAMLLHSKVDTVGLRMATVADATRRARRKSVAIPRDSLFRR